MNINYEQKYKKYKNKYIISKNDNLNHQKGGNWPPDYDTLVPINKIEQLRSEAHKAAYDLLIKIFDKNKNIKIATGESLTAGLIFSTLVDIPFMGWNKYGCFGVYDSDAKRVFIGVKTRDVYTNKCAKEMAIGILKNSNASLAIAVTGNAMPIKGEENRVGEVFVGIAGYTGENEITVATSVTNLCKDLATCELWLNTPKEKDLVKTYLNNEQQNAVPGLINGYNDLQITSIVSQFVRNLTVKYALTSATQFVNNHNLIIPSWIKNNIIEYVENKINMMDENSNNKNLNIPKLIIKCDDINCDDSNRNSNAIFK